MRQSKLEILRNTKAMKPDVEQTLEQIVDAVLHCVKHHHLTCHSGKRQIMDAISKHTDVIYKSIQSVIEQIEKECCR